MIWKKVFNRMNGNNISVLAYVIEVLLIIFSILIAIQFDRYNQRKKNEQKLHAYMQAVYQDLLDEQTANINNLADCKKDLEAIENSLRLKSYNHDDSLQTALHKLREVFSRGVFRAFPPTTFDMMQSTGDLNLIQDLEFRKMLASIFSFRNTYLKSDLLEFDQQTTIMSVKLGQYIDLPCITTKKDLTSCLTDREGFVNDVDNELFVYQRLVYLRAFHLKNAVSSFQRLIEEMERRYPGLKGKN